MLFVDITCSQYLQLLKISHCKLTAHYNVHPPFCLSYIPTVHYSNCLGARQTNPQVIININTVKPYRFVIVIKKTCTKTIASIRNNINSNNHVHKLTNGNELMLKFTTNGGCVTSNSMSRYYYNRCFLTWGTNTF